MIGDKFLRGKLSNHFRDWIGRLIIGVEVMLRRRGGDMRDCPSEEMLAAFVDHCLNAEEKQAVGEHLGDCWRCRKIVVLVFRSKEAVPDPWPTAFD